MGSIAEDVCVGVEKDFDAFRTARSEEGKIERSQTFVMVSDTPESLESEGGGERRGFRTPELVLGRRKSM